MARRGLLAVPAQAPKQSGLLRVGAPSGPSRWARERGLPDWEDPLWSPEWQEEPPAEPTGPTPEPRGLLRREFPLPEGEPYPDRHPYLMPIPIPDPEDRAYRLPAVPDEYTLRGEMDALRGLRNREFERPKTHADIGLPPPPLPERAPVDFAEQAAALRQFLLDTIGPGTVPGRLGETFRQWYWPNWMRPGGGK